MITRLWSSQNICDLLGVNPSTMSNWKNRGIFPVEFDFTAQDGTNGLYTEESRDVIYEWNANRVAVNTEIRRAREALENARALKRSKQ